MRGTYNDGWREYDELQPDGEHLTITNPPLTESEFVNKFKLEHIEVMAASILTFWYGQSDLFAGHSIFVESFDGLDMSHAKAQMFG